MYIRSRPELSQKCPSLCFTDGDAHFTAMRFSAPPRGKPGAPCSLSDASTAAAKQRQGPAHDRIPRLGLSKDTVHTTSRREIFCLLPPTPRLTDRSRAAFCKLSCRGCALTEIVLARYWQLSGAVHGMSLAASLDSAQHFWQLVFLTSVRWSPLTGHTVQSWPLQVNAAFHAFTVGADLLVWCLKISCQRARHLRRFSSFVVSQDDGKRCIGLEKIAYMMYISRNKTSVEVALLLVHKHYSPYTGPRDGCPQRLMAGRARPAKRGRSFWAYSLWLMLRGFST